MDRCRHWNDTWIGRLYDELEPGEDALLEAHLSGCAECRQRLGDLADCRRILQQAAPPVPAAPRVLVLRPQRWAWRPLTAFAAGVACAALWFTGGWLAGEGPAASRPDEGYRLSEVPPHLLPAATNDDVALRLAGLEQRVSGIEQPQVRTTADPLLTRAQLRHELDRLEQSIDTRRREDLSYVIESITATQLRTGAWMDQTEEAIELLSLRQNPQVRDW